MYTSLSMVGWRAICTNTSDLFFFRCSNRQHEHGRSHDLPFATHRRQSDLLGVRLEEGRNVAPVVQIVKRLNAQRPEYVFHVVSDHLGQLILLPQPFLRYLGLGGFEGSLQQLHEILQSAASTQKI